jgi:predicted metal-dependent phosphoesterase TrpH
MSLRIDLHVHTQKYSSCSHIPPEQLIRQAVKAGLDGLVITEHQYQWGRDELEALAAASSEPGFLLLAGMEYWSAQGDILIYGLPRNKALELQKGLPPEDIVRMTHELGGVCVAAHPTRAGMGFDERIATMPLDGIEVRSVNLMEHEQRLALKLASDLELRTFASSDAHQINDVGLYATEFSDPIRSMQDLQEAIKNGRFRVTDSFKARTGLL